jgi:hypothetical protein
LRIWRRCPETPGSQHSHRHIRPPIEAGALIVVVVFHIGIEHDANGGRCRHLIDRGEKRVARRLPFRTPDAPGRILLLRTAGIHDQLQHGGRRFDADRFSRARPAPVELAAPGALDEGTGAVVDE